MPEGVVFTLADFGVASSYGQALAKAINRKVLSGEISKISKGKYYKPKKTVLGAIKPTYYEFVKDFLFKDGKVAGYISGIQAFTSMGLTSQISSSIMIGTNKYRRPIRRGEYKISFLLQNNPITEENIELLRILDTMKMIREIPSVSPDEVCQFLIATVKSLSLEQKNELLRLSLGYTPYVRALAAAICEAFDIETDIVRKSLNSLSSYKLPISGTVLPNKSNWNII